MKGIYSYKWLRSFFKDFPVDVEDVSKGLLLHSFEVESVEQKGDDTVYELDILPSRSSDCLCHYGIAKELSAIFNIPLQKRYFQERFSFASVLEDCIQTEHCDRYAFIKIENCTIAETPEYIKERLHSVGQKCISPIVDMTNYLMYEVGQPLHAFDARKVSSNLGVRQARDMERITLLGGREVQLKQTDIVIVDAATDKPIALAGVKGGEETGVDENTTEIYLEVASFSPYHIRTTMHRLNEFSDAAGRFSQGIPPEFIDYTAHAAVELFSQYGTVTDSYDAQRVALRNPTKTGVALSEIQRRLGVEVDEKTVADIFTRLHLEHSYADPLPIFLESARAQIGKPYMWGASVSKDAPERFDCSSFISWCALQAGLSIPRVSVNQALFSTPVADLQPGDIICSVGDTEDTLSRSESLFEEGFPITPGVLPRGISHTAIVLDSTTKIEAVGKHSANKIIEIPIDESKIVYKGRIFNDEKRFIVRVPVERTDLQNAYDLIEEIGRLMGYDQVPSNTPDEESSAPLSADFAKRLAILTALQRIGFSEVITYSFRKKGQVYVTHPVATDKGGLRQDLREGMELALQENAYKGELLGLAAIQMVEIGSVFTKDGEKLHMALGAVATDGRKKIDYKEIERRVKECIGLPGGFEGSVWEVALDSVEVEIGDTYTFPKRKETQVYRRPSKYPFVLRDVSVFVPTGKTMEEFKKDIESVGPQHLVRINDLDEFERDGKVSYAVRMVFQSHDETLTDALVNKEMDILYAHLEKAGYVVR